MEPNSAPPKDGTERVHVTRSGRSPAATRSRADGPSGSASRRGSRCPLRAGPTYRELKSKIQGDGLHTVCEEAACPNIGECWERGTATFMILGDVCTRRCGFCNVQTGVPTFHDELEPLKVANQVRQMGLIHAVITSVDRDDLPDYGAGAFVGVIRSIRRLAPDCKVEILTPDFRGQEMPLAKVIHERPDVFNHNVETVPRLYPKARRGSEFQRSARVLKMAKEMGGDEGRDQVGPDGRPRRDLRRDGRDVRPAARARRADPHRRPVPAADREPPARRALLAPGRVQGARGGRVRAWLRRGRLRAAGPQLLPRRRGRGEGRLSQAERAAA